MGFRDRLSAAFGGAKPQAERIEPRVYAAAHSTTIVSTSQDLEAALRGASQTASGVYVTTADALRISAVYACIRIRSGVAANMPMHVMRRVDDRTREMASDHPMHDVLTRKSNRWMKPAQFRRMMTAHKLLRGNAFAMKVRNFRGEVTELIPMHPDRVTVKQTDSLALEYAFTRKDGRVITLQQSEVFHLFDLTFDGFTGVTPLTFARETVGKALAMEDHESGIYKNGAKISGVLSHPKQIGKEGLAFISASLDQYRDGAREGKDLILEEGMTYERMALTAEDAQFVQSKGMTNSDIYRFFGIPPHMAGDTEKSTSWGTGIEEQTNGFIAFTAEDDLKTWEEAVTVDLLDQDRERNLYATFRRGSLIRGNLKTQVETGLKEVQFGTLSPNEYRTRFDINPREGGDEFYPPPNTTIDEKPENGGENVPAK
jgi:HK97 family phage portal protein